MQTVITLYLGALVSFIVLDFLWLGIIARGFYKKYLGYIMGEVVWSSAIIFYLLFLSGLTFFVTYPLKDAPLLQVLGTGAFFGLVTYATYDLTNQATLKDWPWQVTIADMIWGSIIGAVVSLCAVLLYRSIAG